MKVVFFGDTITSFNWPTIITSISGSGGLAALVTIWGSNNVKKNEFRWSYKKYILDKRQNAYKTLSDFLSYAFEIEYDIYNKPDYQLFQRMEEVSNRYRKLITYSYWYSEKMTKILNDFNNYFVEKSNEYDEITDIEGDAFISKENNSIQQYHTALDSCYFEDIKELDDIDKFKRKKSANSFASKTF